MTEVISIDKAGRLIIPKSIRDSLGIKGGTKFIVTEGEHGRLLLQKLNIEEIAEKLQKEMGKKDVDFIVKKIRKEVNGKIKRKYKDLFT
jgi:AbrB family looped-hinge helix DNA binding protein